jgi:cell division protein FtsI (penicillin-binding protein 3)
MWALAISGRLAWLQILRNPEFLERAKLQQQRMFDIAPRRGILYDRNMHELAATVQVDSVYAVPSELENSKDTDALILSEILHHDPNDEFTSEPQIAARLNSSRNFAWIARKLDQRTADRVRALNLKGIYMQKEFKRFYPSADLGSPMIGFVGTDDDGLGGLEEKFDNVLHGEIGHVFVAIDAKRHVMDSEEMDPLPGKSLQLTIDSNIQYMAERSLDEQMAKVKASHGSIVVQDPRTGQILALAVSPRFDPNTPWHLDRDSLTNHAVSDTYEPGSTFKLVTYSAAIDAAGAEPTDIIDCQGGSITLFGRTIHDDKSDAGMGKVTLRRALEKSSDVAAVKLALLLGPEKFYSYIKAFGFGDRSGIELPSESRGILRPPARWGSTSIGSLAIGQEVGVTPVQLVAMVSAIANGGVYIEPRLLLKMGDDPNKDSGLQADPYIATSQLPHPLPTGAHRVISEITAAKMRSMMQGIVEEGTGEAARLNGYSAAGKTGTAQKYDESIKSYSHKKLVASFAGFAPVSAPAISVTVVIDTPTVGNLHGSSVSAPVFREVAQEVLEYLNVPHDRPQLSGRDIGVHRSTTPQVDIKGQPKL